VDKPRGLGSLSLLLGVDLDVSLESRLLGEFLVAAGTITREGSFSSVLFLVAFEREASAHKGITVGAFVLFLIHHIHHIVRLIIVHFSGRSAVVAAAAVAVSSTALNRERLNDTTIGRIHKVEMVVLGSGGNRTRSRSRSRLLLDGERTVGNGRVR